MLGDRVLVWLVLIGATLPIISVFAAMILLDRCENSFSVPPERASRLVAGIAAHILAVGWGQPMPSAAETAGAALLIGAVLLLSVASRFDRARTAAAG